MSTEVLTLTETLRGLLEEKAESLGAAGAVAGVSVGDEEAAAAWGCANLNTGQPFTTDTGWLLG